MRPALELVGRDHAHVLGGDLEPSPEQVADARRTVAGRARDAEDLRLLLAVVGLRVDDLKPPVKECIGCGAEKPVTDYWRTSKGLLSGRCRACERARKARSYLRNRRAA